MIVLEEIRCPKCNKKLMTLNGQAEVQCPRCKALLHIDTAGRKLIVLQERQKEKRAPVNK